MNIPRIRYISPTTDPDRVYGSNIHIGTTPSYDTAADTHRRQRAQHEAERRRASARPKVRQPQLGVHRP